MKRKILFLFLTLSATLFCFGQHNVTGVVKFPDGTTAVGVNVRIKGTQTGVVTDVQGKYSLQVPDTSSVLTFSFMGAKTVEEPVNGKTVINIEMKSSTEEMEQVVVVGYAAQKRNDISGSISVVSSKDMMRVPTPSVEQALQGQAAGVNVTAATGAPGAPIAVRIRGVGSISSSGNDPLYIIDGIPAESMRSLSPNDIENITILKDASSAAIYGSRANNGIVLITTKQGVTGKAKVEYNMQIGLQTHGKLIDLINTKQFIELYNEATLADNATSSVKRPLINEASGYLRDFGDVNWLEEIFRPALMHTHEFSVSGGTEKVRYLVSASYFSQDGIVVNTNFNRFSLRSNITADVKKWLTVGLNVLASSSFEKRIPSSGDGLASKANGNVSEGGSVIRYAMFMNPARPVFNPDGSYADSPSEVFGDPMYNTFFDNSYNPLGLANMTDMSDRLNSFVGSSNILVKLPHNITIKGVVGIDYGTMTTRRFNNAWGTNNRIGSINSMNVGIDNSLAITSNVTLNHNFTIADKHNFNYFAGTEIISQNWKSLGGSDGELGDIHYLGFGQTEDNVSQGESDARLMSFFASFNYNFDRKYYISALIREDGSSRFSKGNRWGTFYSVSASWNMEKENFMKDITAISKFKWRVGWGSIGNQNVEPYSAMSKYGNGRYYPFGTIEQGYYMTSLGNTNLKWETSNQLNVGIDMEFLDGSLGANIDYFYKVTDNMIVQASYPPSAGLVSFPYINNGSVLNTGVDLELFYRKHYKKGSFEIKLNGGYLHNEVLSLLAPIESGMVDIGLYATRCVVGRPVGSFYLYEFEGIFQDNLEIMTHATQGPSGTIKPGDAKYKDQNDDNVIDEKDRVYQGSAIPKFSAGLTLSGEYAGFDLNIFFQGAFGQKIYVQFFHDAEGFYRGFPTTVRYYEEHWTPENHSNTMPRAAWSASQNHRAGTTRFLQDGSYVRLKNIQLGYTIPGLKKAHIERLRIYLSASNLFTITKYTGLDPEMTVSANSTSEGDRANGIDWGTYPNAITYSFGLNLTF
ncbi:MAG: TonB-dependent receptor [Bacteroidales bacterium]|jgi:TonB-linked SusC/RagA family outer membrane protein|nr:TonB-dependent receptor [Bacteroidales bacterium]